MFSIKRKILIVLLSLGTVGGFASGFMSLRCRAHSRHRGWRAEVTDICAAAVKQAGGPAAASPSPPPSPSSSEH
jgi:hypothetical protein